MRNIKLTLQYDGTNYCGWQIQPNGVTIQGLLTDFLSRLEGKHVVLYGAGRTDAGVHAMCQVANFFTEKLLPCSKLKRAINGNLPPDIRVIGVEEVAIDFHSRFSAKQKTYLYQLAVGEVLSPFQYHYFYHYPYPLDLKKMQLATEFLIGTHNFAAFATSPDTDSFVRTLTDVKIEQEGEKISFQVSGNGFLRYMVRTIVGTLLEVGRGKITPEQIAQILASAKRTQSGPTAPAHGLTLLNINY